MEKYHKCAEQARFGTLSSNFKQWDLADKSGWTVALEPTGHVAAAWGHFPADFDQGDSANSGG
jgi:hypothetical protein